LIESVSKVLNVTSSSRLGSDYTGRADVWQVAASKIAGKPLQGYGFRTRETADLTYITDTINGHSGVLNILLDVGYIGLALFAVWYVYAFWQAIDPRPHPLAPQKIVIASFLVGNVAILALEPNYISFANPTAFVTLLALSFPLVNFAAAGAIAPRRQRPRPRGFQQRPRYLRV
jgi:O-antigen ligase